MSTHLESNATASTSALQLEAIELQPQTRGTAGHSGESTHDEPTLTSQDCDREGVRNEEGVIAKIWHSLKKFWSRHISLTVSHDNSRDHFGTLLHNFFVVF